MMSLVASAASVFAANPFLPLWEYVPDGEPYVFEDPDHPGRQRVYLYGSHDICQKSYCGRDQVVWSAPVENLNDWRFDGVAFRSIADADGRPLDKHNLGDVLFAPDVTVTQDAAGKKTYWLYPNTQAWERNGQIAKSDRPDGPFAVCNWTPGQPRETYGVLRFDPAVLTDDDGRIYGYWGFRESFAAELDPATMCTVKPGTLIVPNLVSGTDQPGIFRFFEASSIRKIDGKYVFIYSRWTENGEFGLPTTNYTLAYAYSDNPLGPFTYGGTIIDCRGREKTSDGKTVHTATPTGNTHGSLCEINGKWYVFYHRQSGTDEYSRQAMVAPVTVSVEKGAGGKVVISEAEYTSEGFETDGLDPFERHAAGIACHYTGTRPSVAHYPNVTYPGPWFLPFRGDFYEQKNPYDPKIDRSVAVHVTPGSTLGYKYFDFDRFAGADKAALACSYVPGPHDGWVEVWAKRPSAAAGGVRLGGFKVVGGDGTASVTARTELTLPRELTGKQALYLAFASPLAAFEEFRFERSGKPE